MVEGCRGCKQQETDKAKGANGGPKGAEWGDLGRPSGMWGRCGRPVSQRVTDGSRGAPGGPERVREAAIATGKVAIWPLLDNLKDKMEGD